MLESAGSRLALVEAGVLRPPPDAPIEQRLAAIARGLRDVLARHAPQAAAVEDAFVKSDPRAALALGQARGVLLAVLGEAGLAAASYPPASVKRAVAGHGKADKARLARMVAAILSLQRPPEPADATDALAVAIAHALRLKSALPAERGRRGFG